MYISSDLPHKPTREVPGRKVDMKLLLEGTWLLDTEVRYHLQERDSQWHLTMLYIALNNPLKFICRKINTYNSEKKAIIFAKILQRGIRKDARGTFKTNEYVIRICDN